MASLNRVLLIGNLGRDPEVRFSQDGKKIVNMSVACSESWKDKNSGEKREKTEWVRVVIFNDRMADVAEKYLKKGSQVYLEGKMQTRRWTDQSGVEKYTTEVVLQNFDGKLILLGGRGEGGRRDDGDSREPARGGGGGEFNNGGNTNTYNDLDDEIPFVTRWGLR